MINDTFVFDGVLHLTDLSTEGLPVVDKSEMEETIRLTNRVQGGVAEVSMMDYRKGDGDFEFPSEFGGSLEAVYEWAFENAPLDMGVVGNVPVVPLGAILRNPDGYLDFAAKLVKAYPERFIFGGGTDPSGGIGGVPTKSTVEGALDAIEHQIADVGARSIKFYPITWRCDDEEIAYPMYEKVRSLGVNIVQFHKNIPSMNENVETQGPFDLQKAARDFPDMTFLLHHPMQLYFHETVSVAQRFPNIHLVLTPLIHYCLYRPKLAQEMIGHLLNEVGSEKLIYGSEGILVGSPKRVIEAFMNMEIPEEMQEGYGFPQITARDRANIMGLNLAKLYGIDVPAKQAELAALPAGR